MLATVTLTLHVSAQQTRDESKTQPSSTPTPLSRLLQSYPDALKEITANALFWRDGTAMPLDAPNGDVDAPPSTSSDPLIRASVRDMVALPYPIGEDTTITAPTTDPGRSRPSKFFLKMYGDCRKGEVQKHLTKIAWLPGRTNKTLQVTRINGVDKQLSAISRKLAKLPTNLQKFLKPAGGTFNCRQIAGTDRLSAHSYGIAIDIAVKYSDYWRWHKPNAAGKRPYRNKIPLQIVEIFEAHGFIWGGRWKHYDTMHFEYRPELLPAMKPVEK